jgi:hypothetical protein
MRHSLCILAVVCGLFVAGCDGGDRHMTRKVATSEIVGTWKMTAASLQLLKRDGYVPSPGETQTITFNADGSLAFASVLDDFKAGTYNTCSGMWKLNHDKTIDNETVRANAINIELKRTSDTHLRTLSLAEVGGKLRLWNFYGDPDSWEFIEYERP